MTLVYGVNDEVCNLCNVVDIGSGLLPPGILCTYILVVWFQQVDIVVLLIPIYCHFAYFRFVSLALVAGRLVLRAKPKRLHFTRLFYH